MVNFKILYEHCKLCDLVLDGDEWVEQQPERHTDLKTSIYHNHCVHTYLKQLEAQGTSKLEIDLLRPQLLEIVYQNKKRRDGGVTGNTSDIPI